MDNWLTDCASDVPQISDEIFRAYDIRGVVERELTPAVVRAIGKALGSSALDQGQQRMVVGRDGRLSGETLLAALTQGLLETGIDVIDVGMLPTPVLYFAIHYFETQAGVILTGSHNPADYNGLKMVVNGTTLSGDAIQALKHRIRGSEVRHGQGSLVCRNILGVYQQVLLNDIKLPRPMRLVVDCGNGVTGALMPELFEAMGCEVDLLYGDVDGHFPNHHPDPSKPANLETLCERVCASGADVGIAFDGDGDRLGVVTPSGQIIYPDRLMMLFSQAILEKTPDASIVFDVKCTSDLPKLIEQLGGQPIMSKTGHSLIKAKLKETQAQLAGEMSGHIFFNDRWFGFDDALYSAARLLEVIAVSEKNLDQLFEQFPKKHSTPELNIPVSEAEKFELIEQLHAQADFDGGVLCDIDGVRVDYPEGWGLVRASNTTPVLVARFEAASDAKLIEIQDRFRQALMKVKPSLQLPF